MNKDIRCGTCKFHNSKSANCEYLKRVAGPLWAENCTRQTLSDFGKGCKVWEAAEPNVPRKCGTCEHWAERGHGSDGYGHGPCMADVPIWAIIGKARKEMNYDDGKACSAWKWREYEEDLIDAE